MKLDFSGIILNAFNVIEIGYIDRGDVLFRLRMRRVRTSDATYILIMGEVVRVKLILVLKLIFESLQ